MAWWERFFGSPGVAGIVPEHCSVLIVGHQGPQDGLDSSDAFCVLAPSNGEEALINSQHSFSNIPQEVVPVLKRGFTLCLSSLMTAAPQASAVWAKIKGEALVLSTCHHCTLSSSLQPHPVVFFLWEGQALLMRTFIVLPFSSSALSLVCTGLHSAVHIFFWILGALLSRQGLAHKCSLPQGQSR